jgi:hypothetical protein
MAAKRSLAAMSQQFTEKEEASKRIKRKDAAPKTAKPDRPYHISFYIPQPAMRHVKKLAAARDKRPHHLMIEGIDLMLRKYGQPTVQELVDMHKAGVPAPNVNV